MEGALQITVEGTWQEQNNVNSRLMQSCMVVPVDTW